MPRKPARDAEIIEAWNTFGDRPSKIGRHLGLHHNSVQYYIKKLNLRKQKAITSGVVSAIEAATRDGGTFICTSAQNNTYIHEPLWQNLNAYAEAIGAEILVGSYSYNKQSHGPKSVKRNAEQAPDDKLWYDKRLLDHFADDRLELAPGLVWCGEQNIMPTAVRPLTGLENYTRQSSGIFPHAKFQLQSVARMPSTPQAKFNYTTGTVTQRNYIARKAGLRAEFHHCYGAVVVETMKDGRWFVRQLNADDSGKFYDLDVKVEDGRVKHGHWTEAITWGDIHAIHLDPTVKEMHWAKGGMLDVLRPRIQFFHDLLDFYSRNHWDIGNHHRMFERFVEGRDSVEDEMAGAAEFLAFAHRDWCQSIVVDSNHDNALERWLREADFRKDPKNAVYYLEAQRALYAAKAEQNHRFHLVEWAMRREPAAPRGVRFLRPDESFPICNGAIECGMHGNYGTDSSRGSPANLAKMGTKVNSAHTHRAEIFEGVFVAGMSCDLNPHYARGPHSRSHSDIVTYENGKRTIVTSSGDAWRAGGVDLPRRRGRRKRPAQAGEGGAGMAAGRSDVA